MFEPLWKKMGGVLTDIAAVAVVVAATVVIERLFGTARSERPDDAPDSGSST
jgi:hypothetical protein